MGGFDKNATAYDNHRPGYTEQSIEQVLGEIELPNEVSSSSLKYEILELGAGTGMLTRMVAPKVPPGCRYLAAEPSLNFLERLKLKSLPVETAYAFASSIPLPDNSVQNVLCGSCLHWFCDEASLKEIHRVLVPGGKLISIMAFEKIEEGTWNMEIYKQRLEVIERAGLAKTSWGCLLHWLGVLEACGLFNTVRKESLPGKAISGGLDAILKYIRTVSCYNALPEDVCQTYVDRLRRNIVGYPGVKPEDLTVQFVNHLYVSTTTK